MKNNRKGFTLVEVILVLALIGVIITVSYSIFFTGQKSFEVGIDKGLAQEDNRILREYLVRELRYITYFNSQKPNSQNYYSLKIIQNSNGSNSLIKTKYNNGNKEENNTPFTFNKLNLKSENGIIKAEVNDKYKFTILLENNSTLTGSILSNGSDEIFYAYPEDIQISSESPKEESNNNNNNTEPSKPSEENPNTNPDKDIPMWNKNNIYNKDDIVMYKGKKYKAKKSNKGKEPTNTGHWELIQ
ncbi:PilW family protein [Tissierella creatinophila]|uniref:Carbohydrate binding domain protein n=1 Tax=Tissierella creatinophila DSM 6911 TaxID=1123403 RepID=A0A1U7M696_TISCR|nr:prepilin-type N-terminal cleavage/methylation domain-containing protein [Tissierella creatinophila]OLS02739.1 carbohydrate binding domain protein [Tissierella creatinophila DSM 6911]